MDNNYKIIQITEMPSLHCNDNCNNLATFNKKGKIPKYCMIHSHNEMIYDPMQYCCICDKSGKYYYEVINSGGSIYSFCEIHKPSPVKIRDVIITSPNPLSNITTYKPIRRNRPDYLGEYNYSNKYKPFD